MIQLAITPVILITGLGSLLLTMTNRLGRVVDRTRLLAVQLQGEGEEGERGHVERQLRVMWRRAKWVRLAVGLAAASMLVAGLLVLVIFGSAILGVELAEVILLFFVVAIGLLLGSLAAFLTDVNLALRALGWEVERALK